MPHRHDTWTGALFIFPLYHVNFLTSFMEWFRFLFFNGVTVKTENMHIHQIILALACVKKKLIIYHEVYHCLVPTYIDNMTPQSFVVLKQNKNCFRTRPNFVIRNIFVIRFTYKCSLHVGQIEMITAGTFDNLFGLE